LASTDQNAISVHSFAQAEFARALMAASGSTDSDPPPQVDYLARYCDRLGAKTVVREEMYIDRHFMDEYAAFYSRLLRPPAHSVKRFHLFSHVMSGDDLDRALNGGLASPESRDEIEKGLSEKYLGFISVRPLRSVPIGRTVLRKLDGDGAPRREIWATSTHQVHIANLELRVDGLAFQQQDLAVGACATAALWSALSRVARHEGMRAPTPAEVSEAAARHVLPFGRTLPALSGLTMGQLCEAVRECGFAPEVFRADTMPEIFILALHTYLLSGIPVVLGLKWNGEGHAVTAVGFQMAPPSDPLLNANVPLRSSLVKKLYVHDDRLGPYARTLVFAVPPTTVTPAAAPTAAPAPGGPPAPGATPAPTDGSATATPDAKEILNDAILLAEDWPTKGGGTVLEPWLIDSAVAPVYPKLRLSVRSLVVLAELLGRVMEKAVGKDHANELNVDFRYQRSGDYLTSLAGRTPAPGAAFLKSVMLPRWCAIVRWYVLDRPIAEFIYDTTD
jgi:hypothetical protein